MDDLYSFNLTAKIWRQITTANTSYLGSAQVSVPPARYSPGLASIGHYIYLFGGKTNFTGHRTAIFRYLVPFV